MKNRRNYYRVLQVQPDATPEVIRAAYRTMMQKLRYHPDLGGDAAGAALVNEAYAVLTDPDRRASYDASRERARIAMGVAARGALAGHTHAGAGAGVAPAAHGKRPRAAPDRPPGARRPRGPDTLTCALCRAVRNVSAPLADDLRCLECGSPLRPVPLHGAGAARQRHVPRIEKDTTVRFRGPGGQGSGRARDVSSHGMRMRTRHRLLVGDRLRLDCDLLSAVARVLRCRRVAGGYEVGLVFDTAEFTRTRGGLLDVEA